MQTVLFTEKQKFTQLWLWVTLIFQTAIAWLILLLIPNPATWFVVPLSLLVILLFAFSSLKTEVRPDGVYYRFFPFHFRWHDIPMKDIKRYYLRTYEPLTEYGGWGLRYSRRNDRAYNVKGEAGMQLELTNGRKILFGTGQGTDFARALDSISGQAE